MISEAALQEDVDVIGFHPFWSTQCPDPQSSKSSGKTGDNVLYF
jgi:hypothetical protein